MTPPQLSRDMHRAIAGSELVVRAGRRTSAVSKRRGVQRSARALPGASGIVAEQEDQTMRVALKRTGRRSDASKRHRVDRSVPDAGPDAVGGSASLGQESPSDNRAKGLDQILDLRSRRLRLLQGAARRSRRARSIPCRDCGDAGRETVPRGAGRILVERVRASVLRTVIDRYPITQRTTQYPPRSIHRFRSVREGAAQNWAAAPSPSIDRADHSSGIQRSACTWRSAADP